MWVCGPSMSVVVRQRFIRRAGWRGDGLAQVVRALSSGSPSGPGPPPHASSVRGGRSIAPQIRRCRGAFGAGERARVPWWRRRRGRQF